MWIFEPVASTPFTATGVSENKVLVLHVQHQSEFGFSFGRGLTEEVPLLKGTDLGTGGRGHFTNSCDDVLHMKEGRYVGCS